VSFAENFDIAIGLVGMKESEVRERLMPDNEG
jgi:hypothetical protein